ncbi:uncharacterized protein [Littorina saxatilis]|uniref:uncharacterized protein n=1 Tax=Littorina saxatilis TaxID=31220 RepID=UPI0038B45C49
MVYQTEKRMPNGELLFHKINRADKLFNPKNARMFPTFQRNMLQIRQASTHSRKSANQPCATEVSRNTKDSSQEAPSQSPPTSYFDLVAYYNFEEIRQDTLQLAAPWCLLENSKEQIQVGITEASQVKLLSSTL